MAFRSSTSGEQTVLAATFRKTYFRADIMDAAGVMQDYASYVGYGWVESVHVDENLDQPIAGCTIVLRREINLVGGLGLTTISPLRTDSPANPTGPAATVYRRVKVYKAVVTGSRPTALSTDWKLKFDGVTDKVSMPDDGTLVVTARDKGAYLIDQWASEGADLLQSHGRTRATLEWVINTLITTAPELVGETVYVPVDPNFIVTAFPMKGEPAMDSLQRAAALAAADFRWAWDDSAGRYRFTLTVPDRASPTSVVTLGSSGIVGWRTLDIDRLGVRNVVRVSYLPKTRNARTSIQVSDSASITLYGTRMITIVEGDDSSIDTSTEAEDMANLILADLKDPVANAEIEILPDWRIELGDYLTFSANKYFDIDQSLAVVGIRHELERDRQRTFLTVRGTPSAGYRRWIDRARLLPPESQLTALDNGLSNIQFTDDDTAGTRTYTWDRGANVSFIAFYETLAAVPIATTPFPAAEDVLGTDGAMILSTSTDSWVADKPPRGKQRFGIAVPYYKLGGRAVQGVAVKWSVDPLPSNMSVTLNQQNDAATDGTVDLGLFVGAGKSDWPLMIELWIGEESGAADYTYSGLLATVADADSVLMALKGLPLLYERQRSWSIRATNVAGEFIRASYTEPYRGAVTFSTAVSMDATTATITVAVNDPALFRQTSGGLDLSVSLIVDDISYSDGSPGVTSDADALNPSWTFVFVIGRDVSADFQVSGSVSLNLKSQYDPTWSLLDFGPALIIPPALVPRQ